MNTIEFQSPVKRNIFFDEPSHKYTDDYGTSYTSVTTVIKQYEVEFQREYWLGVKSEQLGVSIDTLSDEWDRISKEACDKGNIKHKYLEDNINSFYNRKNELNKRGFTFIGDSKILNIEVLNNSELQYTHNKIYKFLVDLINKGYTLYSERRIYNYQVGICGTIDILATKGKEFIIVDWKTNKDKLMFKSGYFKKRNGIKTNVFVDKKEYFKYPLHNIEFCKGEVYTLQLSMYAFLTELFGMVCKGLHLWHIREEDVMYNIMYRKQDINNMIVNFNKGI